jgi:hypothetical protein
MLAFFFAEGLPLAGYGKPTLHHENGRFLTFRFRGGDSVKT